MYCKELRFPLLTHMPGFGAEEVELFANMEEEASNGYSWSWEEEKAFENALAIYTEDDDDMWEKIAEDVPGKSVNEIIHHFQLLEEDVNAIESGLIPLPIYPSLKTAIEPVINGRSSKKSGLGNGHENSKRSRLEMERRKGIAWSEEEHRLFLLGLEKYGKGDWRSISRNFVVTRTPTQVASHAQKFFIRLNSGNKDRRRSSIHDITTAGHGDAPVTAQMNATSISTPVNCSIQSSQPSAKSSGVVVFGTAMGPPVAGHGAQQMTYGVQAPVSPETSVPVESVSRPARSRHMLRRSSRR